jgi:hypothetical protein
MAMDVTFSGDFPSNCLPKGNAPGFILAIPDTHLIKFASLAPKTVSPKGPEGSSSSVIVHIASFFGRGLNMAAIGGRMSASEVSAPDGRCVN